MQYILLLMTFGLFGQMNGDTEFKISGKISDLSGPIAGAQVNIDQNYALSSADGYFEIMSSEGKKQLSIRHLGHKTLSLDLIVTAETDLGEIILFNAENELGEVVVTGQFEPQSLRNSVYSVRVIDADKIRLKAPTNVQSVLKTELGMRFSNDLTLGTADVELLGMSGQNVKILLDGLPLIDRGSTRESLNQIDVNNIEKIEIVEGPMSVSYGSDALAGVINIITKSSQNDKFLNINARLHEETVGKEYTFLSGSGTHNKHLGLAFHKKKFDFSSGVSQNFFGGWKDNLEGRKPKWIPKEQYLYYAQTGYRNLNFNIWYRFNGLDETLKNLGDTYVNTNNNHLSATDQYFITYRYFHQLQSEYQINSKNSLSLSGSYTDYSRRTQTTQIDLESAKRTLDLNGNQDESVFNSTFIRLTGQHSLFKKISIQHGGELNLNSSSGERIKDTPKINEIAYFISAEYKPTKNINIRPGFRFINNSVYKAPPLIPSINTKFKLNSDLDLRLAYARGFRSPSLRELYFTFFDANHSIIGNTNLKAETSNSFNGFLDYYLDHQKLRYNITLGAFYNQFNNLIDIGIDPSDPSVNKYLNINIYKTTGFTLKHKFFWENATASLGLSRTGRYNELSTSEQLSAFNWSNELNSDIQYDFRKIKTTLNLNFKYSGKRPRFIAVDSSEGVVAQETLIEGFTLTDFTINKIIGGGLVLTSGVNNLFNVTTLQNSASGNDGAHSTSGNIPMAYGRSYFLSLNYNLSIKNK